MKRLLGATAVAVLVGVVGFLVFDWPLPWSVLLWLLLVVVIALVLWDLWVSVLDRGNHLLARWRQWTPAKRRITATAVGVAVVATPTAVVTVALSGFVVSLMQAPPVYNAVLTPQSVRRKETPDLPVVRSGTETTLTFGIGPKWTASLLAQEPDQRITSRTDNVALTVILSCEFCESHGDSVASMVYRPRERMSNIVKFTFVPKHRDKLGSAEYGGDLVLSVMHDPTGNEYDRVSIPVLVDQTSEPRAAEGDLPLVVARFNESVRSDLKAAADVVLLAYEHQDRRVRVEVQPIRTDLKESLAALVFDGSKGRRTFTTEVFGQKDIERITTSAFGEASGISLQGEFAKRLGVVSISEKSRSTSKLDNAEAKAVSVAIARTGQALYSQLFVERTGAGLIEAIERLEEQAEVAPGDRPLRLLIYTDLSLPWQYLHRVGDVDAKKFWGMRFSLAVVRTNINAPTPLAGRQVAQARKVVFARHASATDASVPLAKQQIELLKKLSDVEVVDSRDRFRAILSAERNNISAIVAFLHATSTETTTAERSMFTLAPRLYFADKDWIEVGHFQDLLNKRTVEEIRSNPRYLGGAPLVILNACETGPSTIALPHLTLENAIFKLGAQGVVATEVSVWIPLGNEVGQRLITRLGEGQTASDALTAIRRELNQDYNNPLGLLYAYYGGPSSGLRR